jgi:hypothetical protein
MKAVPNKTCHPTRVLTLSHFRKEKIARYALNLIERVLPATTDM